jgi:protein MpaA
VLHAALLALTIGHSVQDRPLVVHRVGPSDAARKVLVVGSIHGNERAGIAVTRALRAVTPPPGVQLLLIDRANPDGAAAGTRGNAHGVDLNRNFPWRWRHLGGVYYAGPRPASEPETRALRRLVLRERPAVSVWFHQHLNFVILDRGADQRLVRRYARVARMRAGHYPEVPGGAPRWENHVLPDASAFAVELAAGPLPAWRVRANVRAVLSAARAGQTSLRSLRRQAATTNATVQAARTAAPGPGASRSSTGRSASPSPALPGR